MNRRGSLGADRHVKLLIHLPAVGLRSGAYSHLDALADALFQSGYLDRAEIDTVLAAAPLRRKQAQAALVPSPADSQANRPWNAEHVADWRDPAPPPSGGRPP